MKTPDNFVVKIGRPFSAGYRLAFRGNDAVESDSVFKIAQPCWAHQVCSRQLAVNSPLPSQRAELGSSDGLVLTEAVLSDNTHVDRITKCIAH